MTPRHAAARRPHPGVCPTLAPPGPGWRVLEERTIKALEELAKLGALRSASGYAGGLIVGADVLTQIAGDQAAATLKQQRKLTRERKAREAERAAAEAFARRRARGP